MAKTEAASSARASPAAKWDSPFWEPGPWAAVFSRMEGRKTKRPRERASALQPEMTSCTSENAEVVRFIATAPGAERTARDFCTLLRTRRGGRGDGESAGVSERGREARVASEKYSQPDPGPDGGDRRGGWVIRGARARGEEDGIARAREGVERDEPRGARSARGSRRAFPARGAVVPRALSPGGPRVELKSRASRVAGNAVAPAEGLLGAHGQDGGAEASHLYCCFVVCGGSDRSRVCSYAASGGVGRRSSPRANPPNATLALAAGESARTNQEASLDRKLERAT